MEYNYPNILQKASWLWGVLLTVNILTAQQAQERVYANDTDSGATPLLASVDNASDAADADVETFASLESSVGALGAVSSHVQMNFSTAPASGTPVHVKFKNNPSLLGVGIAVEVQAYHNGNPVGDNEALSSLLNLLNGESLQEIVFTPNSSGTPVAYDAVRITLEAGLLSAGANIDVYEAYYKQDATGIACNEPADVLFGSTSGLLGGINSVDNPYNAIDDDETTYAELASNADVVGNTFVTALYDTPGQAGDSIRVVFENPGSGLLDASVLANSISIKTYDDNEDNGQLVTDTNLLSLSLLSGGSNVQVLTYPADETFNRIEVAISEGLVNALSNLYVYEIEKITQAPETTSDPVVCLTEENVLEIENPEATSTYYWYTAEEESPIHTGITYELPELSPGVHSFFVSRILGCTDESARTLIQVIAPYGNPTIELVDINN